MKIATIRITRVTVLVRKGYTDKIWIYTDLPSNIYKVPQVDFSTEMLQGTGADWVRENLGVEPEVIMGG